ncbi:MAG TPA: TPM domain-containing protein [Stellaceae bacterium]|nr:TPM domain-containing protein [Stellaceae bacterium]
MRAPLSVAERDRIHAATVAVERRTSALFALAIVPVSERYVLFPLLWGAVLALAATGVLALIRPELGIGLGFVFNAALFIALSLVLDWLPLRLMLVPRRAKHAHARQLAHREFAARILANAQHRNGVLFFVSLGERYVEIIADRDIHARVPEGTWDKIVADFIAAVKAGRLADGFIAALDACAAVLETHYPRERDGT